jgi:protoporphyrinogen/coproporphyrinogen III oxidase
MNPVQSIVIGAGISGLACAYRLRELGVAVTLLEASHRVGGVIDSVEKDGCLFELGPQSFLTAPPLLELIRKLGLEPELVCADPRAPRYILLRGQLQPAPLSPPELLATPLLGTKTKLRLFSELFQRSHPPEPDESIADFVRRKFGAELLDRLVAPFVSGVYAGDPEQLSLRSAFPALHEWESKYGSLLRGAIRSRPAKGQPRPGLASFRCGVATLVRTLGEKLGPALWLGAEVRAIKREKSNGVSGYRVEYNRKGDLSMLDAAAVVVAAPTLDAGGILATISPRFPELLERIQYAPVAVVGLSYRREQVKNALNGFGFLVPRSEGLTVLGTVWNSSLFLGRAPDGRVTITSFVGGATNSESVALADDSLSADIEKDLAPILGLSGSPVSRCIHRYERALPQYNLGHGRILSALDQELANFPGLFLTGNFIEGPAIGNCVAQANKTAEAAHRFLSALR